MLLPADEEEPQPARRRRGEAGKGFASAWRSMLKRAARHERGRPEATAIGGHATFADICAEAGAFLSETLDYLNPWHDSCANDLWQEEEFNANYWDNFPQP